MLNSTDEIKQRLDLVDLISEYVKLLPAGSNFKALCPFHNEKTPSFMVSPDKQIWHCFGCAKGGDHFTFIQNIEGIEFPEALRVLANRAGVKLEYRDPEVHNHKTRLLDLCRALAEHWHHLLLNDPEAQNIRDYLKKRQLKQETIEDFCLGYAKDSWDEAIKFLQSQNFTLKEIADAGISVNGEMGSPRFSEAGKPHDRFRQRLIFPIRDVHGNVVGFTARKMKEEEQGGKYINTPQTVIYNKSQILYNLDLAKIEIKRLDYAILVEGNMDVLACWQAGTKNAAAVCGTSLTEGQVKLLKRYTQNVMIAFDADPAGTQANLRGIDLAWQAGLNVKVIDLPQDKDPDDLIKESPYQWRELVKAARNFMDYIFDVTLSNLDLTRVDHKKTAAKKFLPLVAKLGNAVERSHYLRKLSYILDVDESALAKTLAAVKLTRPAQKEEARVQKEALAQDRTVAEHLLALIIRFPKQLEQVSQHLKPEMIDFPLARDLYSELIIYYNKHRHLSEAKLKNELEPAKFNYFNQLTLLLNENSFLETPDLINYEVRQTVNRLKSTYLKKRLKEIGQLLAQAERSGNEGEMNRLSEEFTQVTRQL